MVVDALERQAHRRPLLVHARERILEVGLIESPVLLDQRAHEARADARRAGVLLTAARAAAVVDEHLRDAPPLPAAGRGAEPEVPVLAALDEARIVAADVGPELAAVERGHVDRAAREEFGHAEAAGLPH